MLEMIFKMDMGFLSKHQKFIFKHLNGHPSLLDHTCQIIFILRHLNGSLGIRDIQSSPGVLQKLI